MPKNSKQTAPDNQSLSELATYYNTLVPEDKRIKKFSDRATALKRIGVVSVVGFFELLAVPLWRDLHQDLGELLGAVAYYEAGNWELIHARFTHNDAIQLTYEQALEWCRKIKEDLGM